MIDYLFLVVHCITFHGKSEIIHFSRKVIFLSTLPVLELLGSAEDGAGFTEDFGIPSKKQVITEKFLTAQPHSPSCEGRKRKMCS